MHTSILTGPMFSGKTRKLVMSLERFVIAKKNVLWFEPTCDSRGGSHGNYIKVRMEELKNSPYVHTKRVNSPEEIIQYSLEMKKRCEISAIYIDEYHMLDFKRQFFYDYQKSELREIPITFAGLIIGCDAIVLNVAREVLPFMDEIIKEPAICMQCGKPANYYAYLGENWSVDVRIDTGSNYQCLCHDCYMKFTGKPIRME